MRRALAQLGGTQSVQGTQHTRRANRTDMRVDHRGTDVGMTEQLLYRADVFAVFEQVGGKAVSQRMASGLLLNARAPDCRRHRLLNA